MFQYLSDTKVTGAQTNEFAPNSLTDHQLNEPVTRCLGVKNGLMTRIKH